MTILFTGLYSTLYAQECGPSCPVCSGNSEGALLSRNSLLISGIAIPTSEEEVGVTNVRYGIFKWLDGGVGYAFKTKKPIWSLRIQPLAEKEGQWWPGIIIGTGSVQTGKSDQSVYSLLTKSWELSEMFALRVNGGGATLVPEFNKLFFIAGITTSIFEKFSVFANFDGTNFHEGISWIPLDWLTVSVLLVESKDPAVSIAFKLNFGRQDKDESEDLKDTQQI